MIGHLGALGIVVDTRLEMLYSHVVGIDGRVDGAKFANDLHYLLIGEILRLTIHLGVHPSQAVVLHSGKLSLTTTIALVSLSQKLAISLSLLTSPSPYLKVIWDALLIRDTVIVENVIECIHGGAALAALLPRASQ